MGIEIFNKQLEFLLNKLVDLKNTLLIAFEKHTLKQFRMINGSYK